MKKKLLKLQILITFLVLIIIIVILIINQNKNILISINKEELIKFNYESGFYNKSINIKLHKHLDLPMNAKIYYTINGDKPTNLSPQYYTSGIKLNLKENTKVYSLKVIIYYNDTYSDVIEKTYILDNNIENRYELDVINITSDYHNLYDYEYGIMVPGKTYDTNLKNGQLGFIPGNYNNRSDEWLRDSHLIMFDSSGKILLDEDIKLGISGKTSVELQTKSFKIKSKLNNFKLNLYNTDDITINSQVSNYGSFRLRSGSQDINFGNIKSSLMSKLANESGFDGCTTTKRVVVYLNGDFYGIFDVQQNYSSSFLAKKYNIDDKTKIEKYKTFENYVFEKADILKYFNNDLDIQKNRQLLEKYVDMDNYLLYYALNILTNNTDWPQNNFEIWRYNGKKNINNKYMDGRYRFLIYDTDCIYFSSKYSLDFPGSDKDIFVSLMENKYMAVDSTFVNVMKSKYYRDKFINIILDLLNTTFKEENIIKIIDEEVNKINNEIINSYDEENYNNFLEKINIIKEEVQSRENNLIKAMEKYFNLNKKYNFSITNSEGLVVTWNNTTLYQNQHYNNKYYYNTDLKINIESYPGYEFEYVMINGKKYYDNEILITDSFINNKKIEIITKSKRNSQELIISEISAKSDSDWIKITNITNKKINLLNYFLTDDVSNLNKFKLPNINLKPGERIIINGESNYYSIGDFICNFNIKENEQLLLIKENQIIDSLTIPRMSNYESYGRYDNSNIYKFFNNSNNQRKNI